MELKKIASGIGILVLAGCAAEMTSRLSEGELRNMFVGNSVIGGFHGDEELGDNDVCEFYQADGTIIYHDPGQGRLKGKWFFKANDVICSDYDGEGACFTVARATDGHLLHFTDASDGSHGGYVSKITPGNQCNR